jgi:anti-sigma factor RsiW
MSQRRTQSKRRTTKTCKQITDLLLAYVNDELSPRRKRVFRDHLKRCPDCVSFVDTYKQTIRLTGTLYADEIPPQLSAKVGQFLRRQTRG